MSLPAGLNTGRTYYWRVDEVQGNTVAQGVIWRFTTARIRTIDGFEEYKPSSMLIYETWIDGQGSPPAFAGNGTGAYVGHDLPPHYETELVHGGNQSMPLYYDNTGGALFSETNRSFGTPQDWTSGNMKSLVLYYRGDPTNTLGPQDRLYLAVKDAQDHEEVVVCSHRATLLQRARWHQWKIDLDQLSQLGINLRTVMRISIGVGNRAQPLAGGTGLIFIDDLGLSSLEGS